MYQVHSNSCNIGEQALDLILLYCLPYPLPSKIPRKITACYSPDIYYRRTFGGLMTINTASLATCCMERIQLV